MANDVTVLIVEDDELTSADLQTKLNKLGYMNVIRAADSVSAISTIRQYNPDLVIMDVQLKGNTDGIETASYIFEEFNIPVLFLTACSDTEIQKKARISRPYAYMVKPLDIRILASSIESALYRHSIEQENQALQNLRRAAEQANHSKSLFLANMSHELRTPLNSILGFSKLMKMGYDPDEYHDHLDRIISSGDHLLNLINEILDYMKIHAGKAKLNLQCINPEPVINECLKSVSYCANEKNIEIKCNIADFPITVFADKRRLKQIVLNLLTNAAKFTPSGGEINIRLYEKESQCCIEVQDNGPGIAAEDQSLIFEQFEQISKDSSCEDTGSGLGLAITRILVELHGGIIEIESSPGKGSLFRVILAALHQIQPVAEQVTSQDDCMFVPLKGTLLVVEDNSGNREFLTKYFEKSGKM